MPKRYRCSQCDKLMEEKDFVEREDADFLRRLFKKDPDLWPNVPTLLVEKYHRVWGRRYGPYTCGPIKLEEVDEYILQVEYLLGETT